MTGERKFCRFNSGPSTTIGEIKDDPVMTRQIPEGGFCISVFVVLRQSGKQSNVLFGKINPAADWVKLGALDSKRVEIFKDGMMLPSSHLIIHETPTDAASRILDEQLGLSSLKLKGPVVVSETYRSATGSSGPAHWDIHLIFTGTIAASRIRPHDAWSELKFINTSGKAASKVVRNHMDIVRYSSARKK
jgi:REP element-mobilizing transposase RayT